MLLRQNSSSFILLTFFKGISFLIIIFNGGLSLSLLGFGLLISSSEELSDSLSLLLSLLLFVKVISVKFDSDLLSSFLDFFKSSDFLPKSFSNDDLSFLSSIIILLFFSSKLMYFLKFISFVLSSLLKLSSFKENSLGKKADFLFAFFLYIFKELSSFFSDKDNLFSFFSLFFSILSAI